MQQIILRYYHPGFQIAINNWKQVWLLTEMEPRQLKPEHYRGSLVYRLPGSTQRIAYKKIKEGLLYKRTVINCHPFVMTF
ncbi:MAG: hypothetical protein V4685_15760 [Bacteroidota bacterium]